MPKPRVRICSWCQRINRPEYAHYAVDVDEKVKTEMDVVDKQIEDNRNNFHFTNGICILHLTQMFKDMPDKLALALEKAKAQGGGPVPCLLTDTELRHAYIWGLFTPELQKQFLKNQQQAKTDLTERLKTLAGINA